MLALQNCTPAIHENTHFHNTGNLFLLYMVEKLLHRTLRHRGSCRKFGVLEIKLSMNVMCQLLFVVPFFFGVARSFLCPGPLHRYRNAAYGIVPS